MKNLTFKNTIQKTMTGFGLTGLHQMTQYKKREENKNKRGEKMITQKTGK